MKPKVTGPGGQHGQGLIEYLILVVVIAVGAIAIVKQIRTKMHHQLQEIEEKVEKLNN